MAICLASGVKAQSQLKNSEALFFHYCDNTAGSDVVRPISDPQAWILILKVKDGIIYKIGEGSVKKICEVLKNSPNYYDNLPCKRIIVGDDNEFDPDMSNYKWTVFKYPNPSWYTAGPQYDCFWAIKNDFSEYIEWHEPDITAGVEGPFGRSTYKRINKNNLIKMSFVGKRSFLQ